MMASFGKKATQKSTSKRSHTLIESPIVKRIPNQPVNLQSWLLKRGSEGLMLWKKRWCVLSDYCLFYYKDQSEEKLLGSLILASYEISACNADEKGYKKFSFKAEHANMKTFYFAAENQKHMEEWIRALKCASLLEGNYSDERKKSADIRVFSQSSRLYEENQPMPNADLIMGNQKSEAQPVYVNAPPKPKRLNDSSSPECSIEIQFKDDNYHSYQSQPYHISLSASGPSQNFTTMQPLHLNHERRTPDIYGRTNFVQPVTKPVNHNNLYIQDERNALTPLSREQIISYTPKNPPTNIHPRPHSVDFLEYACKTDCSTADSDVMEKPAVPYRPKSSLSAVNTNEEEGGIHWSAEEYARKMRQSSMYVKPPIKCSQVPKTETLKSFVSPNTTCFTDSQRVEHDPVMRSERSSRSLHRSPNLIENNEKTFFRSASARLFRPMSPMVNEIKPHVIDHTPSRNSPLSNISPENKEHKRDKPLERLLLWKERMSQSPLQRKNVEKTVIDQSTISNSQKIKTTSNTSNENSVIHATKTSGSFPFCEGVSDTSLKDVSSQIEETRLCITPRGLCSYPADKCGFEGSESNQENFNKSLANNLNMEKRKINFDEHLTFLDEAKRSKPPDELESIKNNKIKSAYEHSEKKSFLNLKSKHNVFDCDENTLRNNTVNYNDKETVKKITNTFSHEDYNKHCEKKHLPTKINLVENEKEEEWGIKLDESRVIKEFSYHYITAGKQEECSPVLNGVHYNFDKSRKPSSSQNKNKNRDNVHSSLILPSLQSPSTRDNGLSNILGSKTTSNNCQKINNKCQRKINKGSIINKGNSLRSFRKDTTKQLSKEINSPITFHDNLEKRLVQSDSEALLYDTSSDVEEKPIFNRDHSEKPNVSSDEDRDEEVAAVLANEKKFTSPNFSSNLINSPSLNSCDKTQFSFKDSSAIELSVSNDDGETNTSHLICHEKNLSTSTDVNSDVQEENYMPMTPRKKSSKNDLVHSRSNSASHTLIIENILSAADENPYVEMTQNGPSNSTLASNSYHQGSVSANTLCNYNSISENLGYCEIGKNKDTQYEFIYNSSTSQEPVYMEVSALTEKRDNTSFSMIEDNLPGPKEFKQNNSKENIQSTNSSRPSLPDILNTTAPSLNQGSGRSDSSDADDEASKDLDSLDAPRHPRFSLSDTFRPASYYLGGSLGDRTIITINSENQDSSDSDLVSPPPIPTSSPPIDDLDISIDSSVNNKDNIQLKNETGNNYSNELFNESGVKEFRTSYKLKKILRSSNTNLYEASSEESVDFEKREQRLKRRPLSADILNSLQDFSFIMPTSGIEILQDPDSSKLKDIYTEENDSVESSNFLNSKLQKHKEMQYNNLAVNAEDLSIDAFDCESFSNYRFKDYRMNHLGHIYSSNFTETSNKNDVENLSLMNQYENLKGPDCESNDSKLILENGRPMEGIDSGKDNYSSNFNIINTCPNSNYENQNNAPYYYSDLLKIDSKNFYEHEKSKWEDHTMSDINENVQTSLINEKNLGYHSVSDFSFTKNKPQKNEWLKDNYNYPEATIIENSAKHLKRSKTPDYINNRYNNNVNSISENHNIDASDIQTPHRSRSLEGLLDNHDSCVKKQEANLLQKNSIVRLLKTQSEKNSHKNISGEENEPGLLNKTNEKPDIWEEDSLWRENLRKVSIRHTRSLEDLDRKDVSHTPMPSQKNSEETYENMNTSSNLESKSYPHVKEISATITTNNTFTSSLKKNEIKKNTSQINIESEPRKIREVADGTNSSFEIDREKLRQWDLMSSAPAILSSNRAVIKPITERHTHFPPSSLSGNDSRIGEVMETLEENKKEKPSSKLETKNSPGQELEQGQSWNLKVSAGELLGRTHEELVLLLIQLRRQRATVCQSMEKCHRDIEAQACLADLDKTNRVEHLQKLDELKAHLSDLEKQYEKGKPLVNLVDNMVKLGSLYQTGSPEKLEFIQRIQEQRLLAEEKRDWERIRPDHHELKAKVERLYRLDKLLQEESGALHSLQQDKGVLERALGGLRTKLQGIHGNSPETEWYKRQQRLLEKELSRVRSILALNSKKLEETVAENARLEQELVVLRQKLQLSRRTAEPGGTNTAALEAELCQVQLLVGNLLRQRQELSLQVKQLTEKSNSLSRQIWSNSADNIVDTNNPGKKAISNGWIETDLDADILCDTSSSSYSNKNSTQHPSYTSPLYVNTAEKDLQSLSSSPFQEELFETANFSRNLEFNRLSEMNDEEIIKQSYALHFKEKPQEIKTVRIVKRESERRQRDRDRSGNIGIPITYTSPKRIPITEERCIDKSDKEFEEVQVEQDTRSSGAPPIPGPRTDSVHAVWNLVKKNRGIRGKFINGDDKNDAFVINNQSPQLSPVYLSETARKIVEEVAWQGMGEKRLVPKEKRRHHTMSGPSLCTPQNLFSQTGSRDDLDIERVLRPRLTTPDVVRSTLIRVDPNYTKETIDNLLGAPGKIIIPERYIPEIQPKLTEEEQNKRSKKADAIRKMLCETAAVSPKDNDVEGVENTSSLKRKVAEEKKNREHLLQLSHILAQQVMEKSKIVAGGNTTPLD